jgi:carboxylesterase
MGDAPAPSNRVKWIRRAAWSVGGSLVIFAGSLTVYNMVVSARVEAYEAGAERAPATRIMKGFEPILLNTERKDRAVLLVHGFIGAPQNYGTLPQAIADAGWRVEAMNLPGCGTTPHEHEATTLAALEAGVEARLKALQEECETVVLVGHSQGGALSTLVASRLQPDGLVLVAPYFGLANKRWMDQALLGFARVAAPILRWLPEKGGSINKLENEPSIERYAWVSSRAGVTALESCEAVYEREAWNGITMPLLQIHSRGDRVTNPVASGAMYTQFATDEKKLHWIKKSNHVYFWDYDADEVRDTILAFLQRWDAKPEPLPAP